MKAKRMLSRFAVARRLAELSVRIAAGRPIKIGKALVKLPERFVWEESVEREEGEMELEFELKWPAAGEAPAKPRRRS